MIISHKKKFITLAPWKTASSTMRARIGHHCESPYRTFYEYNAQLNRVVHQHIAHAEFRALPESRLGYFTAAFVRNPYDRVASGFRQLQKDIGNQPPSKRFDAIPEWIRPMVMQQLTANFNQLARSGYELNAWIALLEDHQIYDTGHNITFPLHPSHYWTHAGDKPAVSFIGHVETFEKDFERLCVKLKITDAKDADANIHVKPLKGYKYTQLLSKGSIEKINRLFAKDFELFRYPMLK